MTENWYLVLGLEFDPDPVEDQAKIAQKIEEMQKFWASHANHMTKGAEYRKYMQMVPDIRQAMSDPQERERMIKEACTITYSKIDKLLKLLRKSRITDDVVAKVATKLGVTTNVVTRRALALGIRVVVTKSTDNFQILYDQYYKTRPQDAQKFMNIDPLLQTFNVDNLYSFLFPDTTVKNPDVLPCTVLQQRAQEKKKTDYFRPNSDIHSLGRKLCDHCELTFQNERAKAIYDQYLVYTKSKAVLDSVKSIVDISGEFSHEQGEVFIKKLTELFKDRKLSIDILTAFCKIEKIAFNPSKDFAAMSINIKVCRCGCTNDISGGRKVCQGCGADLYINCPQCGTINDATVKVCKCGFKLENFDKVQALCDLAEHALEMMDFSMAQMYLNDARLYWSDSKRVQVLVSHLQKRKEQVGTIVEEMYNAVADKKYDEARRKFEGIRKMFPDFSEPDLEDEIKLARETAGQFLKQAQVSSNEMAIINYCSQAYKACADYPGIRELILQYPPQAPKNLRISADGNSRTNNLSWEKSPSEGLLFYSIVRKKNAIPLNLGDGKILGRVSMCNYIDGEIKPAENYFYAVFAEREGVYSEALVSPTPVINFFEIFDVTILPGNSLLQLRWSPPPKGAMVEVYRKTDAGKEEMLSATTFVSYLDRGLLNGLSYHYRLKLAYNVGGQKYLTNGVAITGIPLKPPKAIDSLSIKPAGDDSFLAVWSNPHNAHVELYCSSAKPDYNFGDFISQEALETKMQCLVLNRISNTSASFRYRGDGLFYVVAAVIKSGSLVFGALARAGRGEMVVINQVTVVNEKVYIDIEPPRGAVGFIVLYRFDRSPEDMGDAQAIKKCIPLKQYQHDHALVLDNGERKKYYIAVFAEFIQDGEKYYSVGSHYLFANMAKEIITYSINVTKKLFSDNLISIGFEAENKSFNLPDIEIMSAVGHVPMFKDSAKLFYTIPAQVVQEKVLLKIPWPKGLPRDTYLRAFLKDDALTVTHQLKLKVSSCYQIS